MQQKKSNENSLFYVQYAYERIKQILKKSKIKMNKKFYFLKHDLEKMLINQIIWYKQVIESIAKTYQVHKIVEYLINLAKIFHSYYEQIVIIDYANTNLTDKD